MRGARDHRLRQNAAATAAVACLLALLACLQTSLQEDDDDDDDERDRRATSCRAIYFPISLPASSKPSVKQAALYSFDQHVIKRH